MSLRASDTSVSSQLVEPEYLTDFAYSVTSCFSVLANLADDVRNLVRTEIAELIDVYDAKEVGSSTMPHKVNPKNFENVKSLWKEFMPRMVTIFMDQISEHQRDLTNSASLRFLPELFTGFCYAIGRLQKGLAKIEVNSDKMRVNFEMTKDKIVAEPLYIVLALNDYPDAYDVTMRLSRAAQAKKMRVLDMAMQHRELRPVLNAISPEQRAVLEDPSLYVGEAAARTLATCDHWEREVGRIQKEITAAKHKSHARTPALAFG
jgi:adenylosuccinate lyase